MVITMVKEEMSTTARKGPWTEQEDTNLVFFVGLFGDRRWDAIARASGLHRTGKSCRLRWVNYLRPGLKRGRMTPHEERLIVDLHSLWGNRWSRISMKLPGRTDNEIKNYWRTHTRKKALESEKRAGSSPELSTSSTSSCLLNNGAAAAGDAQPHAAGLGGVGSPAPTAREVHAQIAACGGFPMEQIWDEIASSDMRGLACYNGEYCMDEASCCNNLPRSPVASQPASWDHSSCETSSLWKIDEEEMKMLVPPLAGDSFAGCVL